MLNKLFILIIFVSLQPMANDLVMMKYGYGIQRWNGKEYEKSEIHPLATDVVYYYTTSENENKAIKINRGIDVSISVQQNGHDIIATSTLHNTSRKSYFISEISLPGTLLEKPYDKSPPTNLDICSMSFLITVDNIMLDYLGGICDYRGNFYKQDWFEIPPQTKFTFAIKLNGNFKFLPGDSYYNIITNEYRVVSDEWFVENSINDLMFSIFSAAASHCQSKVYYIYKYNSTCIVSYYDESELTSFMSRFNFNGASDNYMFYVRSNQVSIKINGNNIKYPQK